MVDQITEVAADAVDQYGRDAMIGVGTGAVLHLGRKMLMGGRGRPTKGIAKSAAIGGALSVGWAMLQNSQVDPGA